MREQVAVTTGGEGAGCRAAAVSECRQEEKKEEEEEGGQSTYMGELGEAGI